MMTGGSAVPSQEVFGSGLTGIYQCNRIRHPQIDHGCYKAC